MMTLQIGLSRIGLIAVLSMTAPVALHAAPKSTVPFAVAEPSAVPGAVLAPGAYTIEVVNRLSDRVVMRVEGDNGAVSTTFLGVENAALGRQHGGPVPWEGAVDGTKYMKGYSFGSSRAPVEFVYPKNDAVKIATVNRAKVPAVDPASEGKPTDSTITQQDMALLNLWVLHLDRVGDEGGGIKAEHYVQASTPKPKPVIARLPQTASMMPVLWLAGGGCLLAAWAMRLVRRKPDASARTA